MAYYDYYPPYESVAKRKAKAEKKLKQLLKKNPDLKPIIIEGTQLAKTWWGKAWNTNLKKYSDYSNRIGRGSSYLRHRAVLDLKIHSGEIKALVQGSSSKPYEVIIKIKPLQKKVWDDIKRSCEGKLESMQELLEGDFPKSLGDAFTQVGSGLFPKPAEIKFDCSCPDWANMCKHVAATLYGIGTRLDENPDLFFTLRKVKKEDLISETLEEQTSKLITKASKKSNVIPDSADNLSKLFGIDLKHEVELKATSTQAPRNKSVKSIQIKIKTKQAEIKKLLVQLSAAKHKLKELKAELRNLKR